MAQGQNNTAQLRTQAHEYIKQYITYDANDRPEYVYTAPAGCLDGAPCSVVRYSYSGVTNRVVYMKEEDSVWDTAWETF